MLLIFSVLIFLFFSLLLATTLSLEIDTRKKRAAFRFGRLCSFSYDYQNLWDGLACNIFGLTWFQKFPWFGEKKETKETKETKIIKPKRKKKKAEKKSPKEWISAFIWQHKGAILDLRTPVKQLGQDLLRLSYLSGEMALCTTDYMLNALLAVLFSFWREERLKIQVNYQDENWLFFFWQIRLGYILWAFIRFFFSRPVAKLGGLLTWKIFQPQINRS